MEREREHAIRKAALDEKDHVYLKAGNMSNSLMVGESGGKSGGETEMKYMGPDYFALLLAEVIC